MEEQEEEAMTKHTPGPWELHAMDDQCMWSLRIRDGNGATIVAIKSRKPFSDADRANAHLMAAAPEMLAALHLVDKYLAWLNGTAVGCTARYDTVALAVRQAIAKAE